MTATTLQPTCFFNPLQMLIFQLYLHMKLLDCGMWSPFFHVLLGSSKGYISHCIFFDDERLLFFQFNKIQR